MTMNSRGARTRSSLSPSCSSRAVTIPGARGTVEGSLAICLSSLANCLRDSGPRLSSGTNSSTKLKEAVSGIPVRLTIGASRSLLRNTLISGARNPFITITWFGPFIATNIPQDEIGAPRRDPAHHVHNPARSRGSRFPFARGGRWGGTGGTCPFLHLETSGRHCQLGYRELLGPEMHLASESPFEQRPQHRPTHRLRVSRSSCHRLDRVERAADPIRTSAHAGTILDAKEVRPE